MARLAVLGLGVTLLLPGIALAGETRGLEIMPAPGETAPVEPAWLYVVGIDEYAHERIPDLTTAVRDAQAVRDVLIERFQFESDRTKERYDEEATREALMGDLVWLAGHLDPDDSLVIYFAGHGEVAELFDQGYWIPHDGKPGQENLGGWVSNSDIRDALKGIKARHIWLISDSCFSGSLMATRDMPDTIDERYYREKYRLPSRQVLSSGGDEPVDDRGCDGHSVFACYLTRFLTRSEAPYLTPGEVYTAVARNVSNNSDQTPGFGALRKAGHEDGEFVLVARRPGGAALEVGEAVAHTGGTGSLRDQFEALERADRERIQVRERAMADLRERAETDYLALTPLLDSGTDSARRAAELYIAEYEDASIVHDGETIQVAIARVDQVNEWLLRQETDRIDSEMEAFTARAEAPLRSREESVVDAALHGAIIDAHGYTMIRIDPGEFWMGSPPDEKDRDDDESLHRVRITLPFDIGATEVTQALWTAVMGSNPSWHLRLDNPVDSVSWCDAVVFCNTLSQEEGREPAYRLSSDFTAGMDSDACNAKASQVTWVRTANGYRLPTEAEWEYAARAGTQTRHFWGDSDAASKAKRHAWYEKNASVVTWTSPHASLTGTQPVATTTANPWGLYDTAGNVGEWVWDRAGEHPTATTSDPAGPTSGDRRIPRGGDWLDPAHRIRSASRSWESPGVNGFSLGLRVVLPAAP